ncbi:glucose 1-dehydrogenase [Micromonospora sp. ALFpr18c]|uniref:SDR family NAD(P)-dependent oxidoreductase n=1 Tax=unclassified Micromonospora TaxID=2617518 RepID=UPI001788B43B|nr:glucose 1-dehydrogenase [Micromonospora sp. ALFpr18c]
MSDFKGKAALITGGSRGIGAAIARRLASDGATVAITYRSQAEAAQAVVADIVAAGGQAVAVQGDVTSPEQIKSFVDQAVDRLGRLDILVSNAGVEHFGALETVTAQDFDRVFHTNVRGQFLATQHSVRHMTDGARIVLTSSASAHRSLLHHTLYAASKAAVESMVRNLAPELGRRGIAINAIAPGGTLTDMAAGAAQDYLGGRDDLDVATEIKHVMALGRLGRPGEIAAAVAFLVSDEASYMTGRTLTVDGGWA